MIESSSHDPSGKVPVTVIYSPAAAALRSGTSISTASGSRVLNGAGILDGDVHSWDRNRSAFSMIRISGVRAVISLIWQEFDLEKKE